MKLIRSEKWFSVFRMNDADDGIDTNETTTDLMSFVSHNSQWLVIQVQWKIECIILIRFQSFHFYFHSFIVVNAERIDLCNFLFNLCHSMRWKIVIQMIMKFEAQTVSKRMLNIEHWTQIHKTKINKFHFSVCEYNLWNFEILKLTKPTVFIINDNFTEKTLFYFQNIDTMQWTVSFNCFVFIPILFNETFWFNVDRLWNDTHMKWVPGPALLNIPILALFYKIEKNVSSPFHYPLSIVQAKLSLEPRTWHEFIYEVFHV